MKKRESSSIRMAMILWVVLLLLLLASETTNGLCPTFRSTATVTMRSKISLSSLRMVSSSLGGGSSSDESSSSGRMARSRQRDREAKTLYDYLGASPRDTQEQLKIRYTTLVRTLHPDSKPDRETQNSYYDLSDINAAWEILKDPLERKKYDRSLQAKEIAEGIESFVSLGIRSFRTTAIPWLQKTADTTAAAVDASTRKAQEVNEQARSAYGVFELEQQSKLLEQKANAETTKASKIQKELDSLSTKKIVALEKNSNNNQQQQQPPLTVSEAEKILKNFQATTATATTTTTPIIKTPAGLSRDLQLLRDNETKHRDALTKYRLVERETQAAARKLEQALKAEELAQQRFEEAQRALKEAKNVCIGAQETIAKAKTEEKTAFLASTKLEGILEKARDKVRTGLLQQQDLFLDRRANDLQQERAEHHRSAKAYRDEAKALRIKANQKAAEEKRNRQ